MAGRKTIVNRDANSQLMYLGDWRINADERVKYDSYFQQCGPTQGYLTGMIERERERGRNNDKCIG